MVLFVRDVAGLVRPAPAARVIPAEQYQRYLAVEEVMTQARAAAAALEADQQRAYQQACERGYAEGAAAAQAAAAEQMMATVARTIDYFAAVEQRMTDLLLEAMQRLLAGYSERERAAMIVRSALAVVRNQKQVTLRVAPEQLELLQSLSSDILADFPGIGYLDVQADSRLQGEACIVETEIGIVEASLQAQINALRSALERVLGPRAERHASV